METLQYSRSEQAVELIQGALEDFDVKCHELDDMLDKSTQKRGEKRRAKMKTTSRRITVGFGLIGEIFDELSHDDRAWNACGGMRVGGVKSMTL